MGLLQKLLKEPAILEHLNNYDKQEWTEVIKKTLVYGIHALKGLEVAGLETKVQNTSKSSKRPKGFCSSGTLRKTIPEKETTVRLQQNKTNKSLGTRNLPSYLKDVGPKIKDQIVESKKEYIEKHRKKNVGVSVDMKKRHKRPPVSSCFKEDLSEKTQSEERSSFSHYEPSSEFKAFYRKEFKKLLPDPSRLLFNSSSDS